MAIFVIMVKHLLKTFLTFKISLADAIALAHASLNQAYLVTTDHHELDAVENDGKVSFHWVR